MKTFKDKQGTEWIVEATFGSLARVRDLAGVDFLQADGSEFTRAAQDIVLQVDVLYALVKPQADTRDVDDVTFGELLTGDAIGEGWQAFMEGLIGFFHHDPIRGPLMAKAMAKTAELQAAAATMLETKMDDPAVMKAVERAVETAGQALTSSLDSLGLIPQK